MISAGDLLELLRTVCPIDNVAIRNRAAKEVDIAFGAGATAQQKMAATDLLNATDLSGSTPRVARDEKLSDRRAIAALYLLVRQARGGAAAPAWALNVANQVLAAIDAAGDV